MALNLKNRKFHGESQVGLATSIIGIQNQIPQVRPTHLVHGPMVPSFSPFPVCPQCLGHRQPSNSDSAFSRSFKAFPGSLATLLAVQPPFFHANHAMPPNGIVTHTHTSQKTSKTTQRRNSAHNIMNVPSLFPLANYQLQWEATQRLASREQPKRIKKVCSSSMAHHSPKQSKH